MPVSIKSEREIALMRESNRLLAILHEELAEMIDIPTDKIADTLRVSGCHVSVDAPFVEGEDNSLLDIIPNDDSPMADNTALRCLASKAPVR